VRKFAEQETQR